MGRCDPVKKYYFLTKGLQSAARIICAPAAHKFHTCSLSGIFLPHMSPKKMIGLLFAASAAKLYEVFEKLGALRSSDRSAPM